MTATRIACVLRHWLWRVVCAVTGGLTALPGTAQPVFVAAADNWFDVPVRRFVATSLAGVLPVRRSGDGTYAALLAAARPALKAGRTVVIYPEGTRSTNGSVAEFRSGALRLARDCGVSVVPVAVVGTAEVLPKGGRFSRAPMQVRIGEPVDPDSASAPQLRAQVMAPAGKLS
jgi:1-acyl-sn-glycerol-3-phosphate acyltransferase